MQLSRILVAVLVCAQVLLTQAIPFSVGVVGLGLAGLAGLKLLYGTKLFHRDVPPARDSPTIIMIDPVSGTGHRLELSPRGASVAKERDARSADVERSAVVAVDDAGGDLVHERTRRDASGGITLNRGFLRWLKSIDDEKCIRRFFCELGADQSNFGNVGQVTNMLIMMGGLPRKSWALDMYDAGQNGKQCPKTCNRHELMKTIGYLERQFFVPSVPGSNSEVNENEILE
ncbi:uncharacterized protein LOC100898628 [Galendromus occidentalis]|uniref:Uncharacterized protein LOC100898628 n=1 Tax=Galendromus occidentalis TaxID=34638 RepID=A0AAJ6QNP0_9ACAR|nr:uncharacterized protein LOC100898628 [Galendromus occidentalis]